MSDATQHKKCSLLKKGNELVTELSRIEQVDEKIREGAFNEEKIVLRLVDNFIDDVIEIERGGEPSRNAIVRRKKLNDVECEIISSSYRQARVVALGRGLHDVYKRLFMYENIYKGKWYRRRPGIKNKTKGMLYFAWGVVSGYGTSLVSWLICGFLAIFMFTSVYARHGFSDLVLNETVGYSNVMSVFIESTLQSAETFLQITYPSTEGLGAWERMTSLIERIVGLVYFGFGFLLLLPTIQLEASRSANQFESKKDS